MLSNLFRKKKSAELPEKTEVIESAIKNKIPKNHKHDTPTFIKSNTIGGQFNDMHIVGNKNYSCSSGFKDMHSNTGIKYSCSSYIGVSNDAKTKLLRHPILIIDTKDEIDYLDWVI